MLNLYIKCLSLLSLVGSVVLGPPMPSHGEKEMMCEKNAVDNCLKKLQTFLTITSLPLTSEQNELDELCNKSLSGYNCSQMLYRNADCLSQKEKDMIPVFIPMAEYMYFMLCGDGRKESGYLRDAFLLNSDCIMKNTDKIDCCAQETQIPEIPILRFLEQTGKTLEQRSLSTCCPISRHIQCVSAIAQDNCGEAALNFTSEYFLRAAGEQIQMVCQKLPDYPYTDTTTCPDPVKTCSGAIVIHQWSQNLPHFIVLFIVMCITKKASYVI